MVRIAAASSVPPHIHPPIAHVPSPMGDALSDVPEMSIGFGFVSSVSVWRAMIFLLRAIAGVRWNRGRPVGKFSIDGDERADVEAGFLGSDQSKRCPVE